MDNVKFFRRLLIIVYIIHKVPINVQNVNKDIPLLGIIYAKNLLI
jgi:hypothetical protein